MKVLGCGFGRQVVCGPGPRARRIKINTEVHRDQRLIVEAQAYREFSAVDTSPGNVVMNPRRSSEILALRVGEVWRVTKGILCKSRTDHDSVLKANRPVLSTNVHTFKEWCPATQS